MSDHLFIADRPLAITSSGDLSKPAEYAAQQHAEYAAAANNDERREFGQFFTPVTVARLMGRLAAESVGETVRLLEPGAGGGVLSAAFCEALPDRVRRLHIDAFEIHPVLAELCAATLTHAAR